MRLSGGTVGSVVLVMVMVADGARDVTKVGGPKGRFRWERDDWFEAQFTGHPKFACAKTGYPRGDKFPGYDRKFLFRTPEYPKSLFCALRGTDSDLQTMIRHVGLKWSPRALRRGGSLAEVSAPAVRCVPRPLLLGSLVDLVAVAGRAPHHAAWCLLAQPPPPPHDAFQPRFPQPAAGALAIRILMEHIPDVLCSPADWRSGESEETNDEVVDFYIQGFLESWSHYFKCNFQRDNNTRGASVHALLASVVLEMGLGSGQYLGRPVARLPAHTCREACPERAPRPDDLLRLTGSYNDDYGVDVTVTSPLGRTATCQMPDRPRRRPFQLEAVFPDRAHLVCHSRGVPVGDDVDGTEFYFIVRLALEFEDSKTFRCKVKNGERLGGDREVEASLLGLAHQLGLKVFREDVELGRMVPSVFLGSATCGSEPPPGYLHHFLVTGQFEPPTQHCAIGLENQPNQRQEQDYPIGSMQSDRRIY